MKEIVLFEIPIYSMNRETFDERIKDIKYDYYKNRIWKYNQIIGYIEITYSRDSIWFELYKADIKRVQVITNAKKYITKQGINGYSLFIEDKYSNIEVADKIKNKIDVIIEEFVNPKYYVDLELFNNIYKNIDYKNVFRKND